MNNRKIQVAVVGDYGASKNEYDFAYEAGKLLAEKGHIVLTGGKSGVMEAAGKGAMEKGGIVVGILPSAFPGESNEYCTLRIATGLGHGRNSIIAASADIMIAIGGKAGTLTEIGYGWVFDKPIIAVKGYGGWSDELAGKMIDDRNTQPVKAVTTVDELNEVLESIVSQLRF